MHDDPRFQIDEAEYWAGMAEAESARAEYEAAMNAQGQHEADADAEAARAEFEASGEQEPMTEDF